MTSSEKVVTLGGQDWDEIVALARDSASANANERIVVNMAASRLRLFLPPE